MTQDTVAWALQAAPRLLLLGLGLMVALRLVRAALSQLESHLLDRGDGDSAEAFQEHEKRVQTLMGIAGKVARVSVWTLFVMLVLVELGVNVGPLIAGAGVLGLALGFGAQELVRDVITGFFMLLENQIRTGDVAIINGQGGLVENIGLRTITLRDLAGTVHVFQNGKVNTLANMTKEWSAMLFDVGVAYKEDCDRVMEVMKGVAEELVADEAMGPKILEPLEVFGVDSFGDSAVVIKARLKTVPIEQWAVGREYRRRLKKAFDSEGIEIPFPHRTLYWGEETPPLRIEQGHNGADAA
ncbi:MAG: mechanosensitive ion channel family protein [Myxococcales bacterium]